MGSTNYARFRLTLGIAVLASGCVAAGQVTPAAPTQTATPNRPAATTANATRTTEPARTEPNRIEPNRPEQNKSAAAARSASPNAAALPAPPAAAPVPEASAAAKPAGTPVKARDADWPDSGTMAARDVLLIEGFCLFSVLLVLYPIFRYLAKQWNFRRDRVFGAMSGDAAVYYYQQFRQGCRILKDHPPKKLNPDEVAERQRAGDDCWFDSVTQTRYLYEFKRDFRRWYGRRYFIAPLGMLVALTLISAYWAQKTLRAWAMHGGAGGSLRALVAAALAGAFMWIVSDELDRLRRRDFSSSDVYYYVFRILLAVPFGWALSQSSDFKLSMAIPIAFFLGAFPTSTLFLIARRLGSRWMKLGDDPDAGALDLERLQSIGKTNAERYKDEGVATISMLAYSDPIDLTIRTNFDFNYVVDCVSQALAWIYFEDHSKDLEVFSLRGAQEIVALTRWADDAKDPDQQAKAKQTIVAAATRLGLDPVAFRMTLDQISLDPYSIFLVNVWD